MRFEDMPVVEGPAGPVVRYQGSEYVQARDAGACWHCGATTKWVDVLFAAFLCSPECAREKWHEYAVAFNKRG